MTVGSQELELIVAFRHFYAQRMRVMRTKVATIEHPMSQWH